ncbi:MAG TPA: VCBS repeat-containing protein, partial [Planctomycetaceae bacterium]
MLRSRHSIWFMACLAATLCGCGTDAIEIAPTDVVPTAGDPVPGGRAARDDDPIPNRQAIQASEKESASQEALPDDWFEDVTARSGVDFTYRNGREAGRFYLIESFGGGAALLDFDRDGDMDLFLVGGGTISGEGGSVETGSGETGSGKTGKIDGRSSGLFRNDGEWHFADVTAPCGLTEPPGYSQGCAITDFNTDGFPDLLVTCYGRTRLYVNQGDGTCAEVTDWAQPAREGFATAAAFGDADRDGFPDLMLAFYTDWTPETDVVCHSLKGPRDLCGPTSYKGTMCRF